MAVFEGNTTSSPATTLGPLDSFCGGSGEWGPTDGHEFNGTGWDGGVDFSTCFEDTFITTIPIVFIFLIGIIRMVYLLRQPAEKHANNALFLAKSGALYTLMLLIFSDMCLAIYTDGIPPFRVYQPAVIFGGLVFAALTLNVEHTRGFRSSGVLTVFWLLSLLVDIIRFRTFILDAEHIPVHNWLHIAFFAPHFGLDLLSFAMSLFKEPLPFEPEEGNESPERHAPFFSIVSFWWLNPLMMLGYKRALTPEDLWELNRHDRAANLSAVFRANWKRQVAAKGDKASLVTAMWKSFGLTFLMAAFFKLGNDLLAFVAPQLLKAMIGFTQSETDPDWHGYAYAAGLLVTAVVQSICLHQYFHRVMTTGMRLRSALISAVFRKSLVLTNSSRQDKTSGEIVNLMAVDSQRFLDLMSYLQMVWSAPLQICLSLYFLWELLGPSVLAGVGVMVLMIPLNGVIAKKQRAYQVKQMGQKDRRIKMMNEVLNGMKGIKLYAWEKPFSDLITSIRESELRVLRSSAYLGAAGSFSWNTAPFLVSLVTFITYTKTGNTLTAEKAFVALSLFNLLRFPLAILPMMISSLVQASVSLTRLREFLLLEENADNVLTESAESGGTADADSTPGASETSSAVTDYAEVEDGESAPLIASEPAPSCVEAAAAAAAGGAAVGHGGVSIADGDFSWLKGEAPTLSNVNISIKPGSTAAVVGQVGSGKSSLVSALLGDMEKIKGSVARPKDVAYVPQTAWIQNATVKDNILFGKEFDAKRYSKVIHACGLEPDLEQLPDGDRTEIGEKGINLSGGQKQRVSLARAVYQDADLYILDDPLSAVDSHVGKHIFSKCLSSKGLLRKKTVLLVTHAIHFLPSVDQVIVLRGGQVTESGCYDELINAGGDFAKFVEEFSKEETEEEEEGASRQESTASEANPKPASKQPSTASASGADKEKATEATALIKKESVNTGNVKGRVYMLYVNAIGKGITLLILLCLALGQASQVGSNFWLSYWSNNGETDPDKVAKQIDMYLGVYGALGLGFSFFSLGVSLSLANGSVHASRTLHLRMLKSVLRSPMSFFDTTPMGRIVNRFSEDIYTIDQTIPQSLRSFLGTLMQVISIIVVIAINTWQFMLAVLPLAIVYFFIQRFYVATSRQLQRVNSVSKSPIYAHFSECLAGVSSIRAYNKQDAFIKENERRVNRNLEAYYPSICANRWLAMRLEFVGNCIIFFAGIFAVVERHNLSGGVVGLSLSYAMSVTQTLNWMVRMSSQLETNIVAVERVTAYSELKPEKPEHTNDKPDDRWPQTGAITFSQYSVRYRDELDLVVKDLNIDIKAGEKIGIVGRTGAGKSSLTMALFRIIEAASGSITIDGKDISKIGLHDLRSKITIMPQDPMMFSGTIRQNLDPFNTFKDSELWNAIEVCHLKGHVKMMNKGLESKVTEGGDNFSAGQRQLLCLARAVLRKTKVLVLDEATSAVDFETDELLQKTIRQEFKDCTILTIAHRLNTIMDSDRVIVLDAGRVVEFDTVPALIATPTSIFYSMAKSSGLV